MAAAAFLSLVLVWLSLAWHRGKLAEARLAGGRFNASFFSPADAVVAVTLALWLLSNALPALEVGWLPNSAGGKAASKPEVDGELIVFSMLHTGGIVVLLLGFLAVRGLSPVRVFGFGETSARRAVGTGLIALLAAYPLLGIAAALGALIPGDFPEAQEVVKFFMSSGEFADRLLVIVMAVVVAPVAEEIIFRGYLYGVGKKYLGATAAAIASAAVFSLVHAHVPSLGVFFLLSLGLSLVVERTGSLLPAMAMHALFNFVSLAMMLLFPDALNP